MRLLSATVLLLMAECVFCAIPFLNTYLDPASKESLIKVFLEAVESKELNAIHHAVSGLRTLGVQVDAAKSKVICEMVQKTPVADLTKLYHVVGIISELKNCAQPTISSAKELIDAAPKATKLKTSDLYLALFAANKLNMKVSQSEFVSALTNALKDDTASSLAYGLNAASLLDKENAEKFLVRTEDLIRQADEVDGKYLQLEGGPSLTALGVYGIYALADKVNKSPNVKSDEAVKLANYLLSRRNVQRHRVAFLLVTTLKKLAFNNFQVPVSFSLASSLAVADPKEKVLIRVSNVLGETVGPLSVNLDAATHVLTKQVVASRKALPRVAGDNTNTLYELSIEEAQQRGFYNLALTAGSQDKRLVGTNGASLSIKVLTEVKVDDVTVAVYDRELSKPTNLMQVNIGQKLGKVLEADTHSKMMIKFTVKQVKTNTPIAVHQAFVVFIHQKTKREIIFVATHDSNNNYIFDVDLDKSAKEFEGLSDKYEVRLIIGDAAVSNPTDWNLVDIILKLPPVIPPKVKKSVAVNYKKLPEIKHLFREPEKRPPPIVSTIFVALCLAPILILFILWLRIGINFGNMPFSLWTIVFHVGLAGIFILYFVFWLKLNMFETLKYLSIIGAITFVAGNRLLRAIAEKRKQKHD